MEDYRGRHPSKRINIGDMAPFLIMIHTTASRSGIKPNKEAQ